MLSYFFGRPILFYSFGRPFSLQPEFSIAFYYFLYSLTVFGQILEDNWNLMLFAFLQAFHLVLIKFQQIVGSSFLLQPLFDDYYFFLFLLFFSKDLNKSLILRLHFLCVTIDRGFMS